MSVNNEDDNAHQQNATVNDTRRLVILVRDNYMASCPIIKAGIITISFHSYLFHYLFSQAISVISFFLCYLCIIFVCYAHLNIFKWNLRDINVYYYYYYYYYYVIPQESNSVPEEARADRASMKHLLAICGCVEDREK